MIKRKVDNMIGNIIVIVFFVIAIAIASLVLPNVVVYLKGI